MAGNLPLEPYQIPAHNELVGGTDPNAHHEKFTATDHANVDHTGLPGIPDFSTAVGYDPATEEIAVKYGFRYGDFDINGQFWHGFDLSSTYIRRFQAKLGLVSNMASILSAAMPNIDLAHRIDGDNIYVAATRFINGGWNVAGYEYATTTVSLQVGSWQETGNPKQGMFIIVNGTVELDSASAYETNIQITKAPGKMIFGYYGYSDDTTNNKVVYSDIIAANQDTLQMSLIAVYDRP